MSRTWTRRLQNATNNASSTLMIRENKALTRAITSAHDICSDVWQQIFQYFQPIELTTTFANITAASDRVLFDENERFRFRGHAIDENPTDLPENISPSRVISLTLHSAPRPQSIEQYSELRSVKLIGVQEWILPIIDSIASHSTKLEQLTAAMPRIRSLSQLLISVLPISSLRRLELSVDDLENNGRTCNSNMASNNVEQFIFRSSSSFDCDDFLRMIPHFANVHLLDISLIVGTRNTILPFRFHTLRTLRLGLLEVPFNWIILLVATITSLLKLYLNGVVDSEGFVMNEKWIDLLESAPSLIRVFVNLSLEQVGVCFHCEKLRARLLSLNLRLECSNDDNDCFQYDGTEQRWWSLKGTIIKSSECV